MSLTGVNIEVTHAPAAYSDEQITDMCLVASYLDRGKLVYTLPPDTDCLTAGLPCELCIHFAAEDDPDDDWDDE